MQRVEGLIDASGIADRVHVLMFWTIAADHLEALVRDRLKEEQEVEG